MYVGIRDTHNAHQRFGDDWRMESRSIPYFFLTLRNRNVLKEKKSTTLPYEYSIHKRILVRYGEQEPDFMICV